MALTLYPHFPEAREVPNLTEEHDTLFFDPEKSLDLLQPVQREAVSGWLDSSQDRERDLRYLAVGGFLADTYAEPDPSPERREALKSDYSRQFLGAPDGAEVDDDTFFGMVKDQRISERHRRELAQGVAENAARFSASADPRFADEQKEAFFKSVMTDPGFKPDDLPALHDRWREQVRITRERVAEVMPFVDMVVKEMKAGGGDMPRGLSGAAEGIANGLKTPEQRALVFELVRQKLAGIAPGTGGGLNDAGPASGKPDVPDTVEGVLKGVARGASSVGRNIGQAAENYLEQWEDFGAGPPTKEAARDIEDMLASIWASKGAPLSNANSSLITRSLVGAAESAVPSFLIAGGPVGAAMTFVSYHEESLDAFRAAGISTDNAQMMAVPAALAKSWIDRVQWRVLAKVPGVVKLEQSLYGVATPLRYMSARVAQGVGITALETGAEVVQTGYVEAATRQVAEWLGAGIKAPSWTDAWDRAVEETPDILLTMIPLTLIGTGAAIGRDIAGARELASSPVLLRAAGFNPDQAAAIASAENPVRALRGMWPDRKPETGGGSTPGDVAEEAIKAVRQESVDTVEAVRQSQSDDAAPIVRTDAGWQVKGEDGQTTVFSSPEAALYMQKELYRANSQAEAESLMAVADTIAEMDIAEGVGTMKTFAGTEQIGIKEGGRTRAFQGDKELPFDAATLGNLHQQMEAAGIDEAIIRGSNQALADDTGRMVRHYQTNQGGDVTTIIHERFQRLIREGKATPLDIFNAANVLSALPAFDPARIRDAGQKKIAEKLRAIALDERGMSDLDKEETIVELLVADTIGRDRENSPFPAGAVETAIKEAAMGQMKPGERKALDSLRSMLRVVKAYLRAMFGLASRIAQARRKGQLKKGDAWTDLVDKLLGLSEQKRHDAAVAESAGVKLDQTYSIAEPAEKDPEKARQDALAAGWLRALIDCMKGVAA